MLVGAGRGVLVGAGAGVLVGTIAVVGTAVLTGVLPDVGTGVLMDVAAGVLFDGTETAVGVSVTLSSSLETVGTVVTVGVLVFSGVPFVSRVLLGAAVADMMTGVLVSGWGVVAVGTAVFSSVAGLVGSRSGWVGVLGTTWSGWPTTAVTSFPAVTFTA